MTDQEQIAKLKRQLEKKETELQQRTEQLNDFIDTSVDGDGRSWKDKHDDLDAMWKKTVDGNITRIKELEDTIATGSRASFKLQRKVSDWQNKFDDLPDDIKEAHGLKEEVEALEGQVSDLDGENDSLQGTVHDLEAQVTDLEEEDAKRLPAWRVQDLINGDDMFPVPQYSCDQMLTEEQMIREAATGSVV